jgi:membrane-anchored glycerophosphoryl diester phosphodiesterase (GDPDase)
MHDTISICFGSLVEPEPDGWTLVVAISILIVIQKLSFTASVWFGDKRKRRRQKALDKSNDSDSKRDRNGEPSI